MRFAAINRAWIKAKLRGSFCCGHCLTIMCYHYGVSAITRACVGISPATVFFTIPLVVVYSIKNQSRRSFTHVF